MKQPSFIVRGFALIGVMSLLVLGFENCAKPNQISAIDVASAGTAPAPTPVAENITWSSIGLNKIGAVNLATTAIQSFPVPANIPSTATQVMVYFRCNSGTAVSSGNTDVEIYTTNGATNYSQFFFVAVYAQNAVSFSSNNFWFPCPSDGQIHLALAAALPVNGNSACSVYVTGYK